MTKIAVMMLRMLRLMARERGCCYSFDLFPSKLLRPNMALNMMSNAVPAVAGTVLDLLLEDPRALGTMFGDVDYAEKYCELIRTKFSTSNFRIF